MFQCRHVLKPDGLFLAAMFGGQTLQVGRALPFTAAVGHLWLPWRASRRSQQRGDLLGPAPCSVQELRIACTVAQQEREGGVSARVSPLAQVGGRGGGGAVPQPPLIGKA